MSDHATSGFAHARRHLGAAAIMLSAMSSDKEDRDPVRRPRVIERPYVPPGLLADLKALIYELYLAAETPTLDEITNGVDRSGGDLVGNPRRDTINRIIGDPGMPASQADVVAVVTVLAREARWDVEDAVMRARDLWVAARMASARCPAAGIRVSQADPRRLGVQAAISVPGASGEVPPEYVPRDADAAEFGVRAKVAAAAQRGGFVLLVGGSSVGKTRCAFEAVTALLPDWWLVHPTGPGEIAALAAAPTPRTVVWLDELESYLDGEYGLTGGVIRMLLNQGHSAVIIGTLWPDRYTAYTTVPLPGDADPYAREREVLKLAVVVRINPTFSPAEHDRACAAAARDPRLQVALEAAGYGLTQTLAAAPQLVARWEDAQTADPYAWAVLTAALDVARLGARAPLSADLLRAAAVDYCTSQQQAEASENWFELALAYATGKLHGAAAALRPAGAGMGRLAGYTAADYLIQYASRERRSARVPASTWDAILSYVRDPADAARLAESAGNRLLYRYAIPLYRHAADSGDRAAAVGLAELLAWRGDLDGLRARADAGDRAAAEQLAHLLVWRGDLDGLRARADAGDGPAAVELAELLAERGDLDEAAQVLRGPADVGDGPAAELLARLQVDQLAERGDLGGLRARADAGDRRATSRLAELLAERGDLDEAAQILRTQADVGDGAAAWRLAAWRLAWRGDLDGLRARADAGDRTAAEKLAELLAWRGDLDGLRARADAGDRAAAEKLAELLAERGDLDGLRARADAGDRTAAWRLAHLLAERGDLDGLRARADAGDRAAAEKLAELLAERGDLDGLRARADAGDRTAAWRVAHLLAERGDLDEAAQVLRVQAEAGDGHAALRLARLLAWRGDLDEAAQVLRARADAGDGAAVRLTLLLVELMDSGSFVVGDGLAEQLADLMIRQGRHEEAEQLRRFGLNPDGSIACA